MTILIIIQTILGLVFALFVPGFLIVKLFFDDLEMIEQIALAIGISIMIDVLVGIFLGYNESWARVTGGITAYNVWFYMLTISALLGIAVIIKMIIHGKGSKKVS